MFLLNTGFRWNLANDLDEVRSIVMLPQGNSLEQLTRRSLREMHRVILDPQLYLAGLDAAECKKTCARLASFPWFDVPEMPEFDSGSGNRRDWEKEMQEAVADQWPGEAPNGDAIYPACVSAIETQIEVGCTHLVLPSPLISDREDEAASQAEWLDSGLRAADDIEIQQPLLTTVAISDKALNDGAFKANGFLDTVVDQVTARDGIDGVYIVVMQSKNRHPFDLEQSVYKAYCHLSQSFSGHFETVLVNFADVFGMACYAVGATGFATGNSHALRKLCPDNFLDDSRGKALPHFYSHQAIAEPFTETDLNIITGKRLLSRVYDVTKFSADLMRTLKRGGTAAELSKWAESQNNLLTASKHFITRLSIEADRLEELEENDRADSVREWLETAAANQLLIEKRTADKHIKGCMAPAEDWSQVIESYRE